MRYRRAGSGDPDTRVVFSLDGRRAPPPFVRQYDGSIYAYALADTEVALEFDEFDVWIRNYLRGCGWQCDMF